MTLQWCRRRRQTQDPSSNTGNEVDLSTLSHVTLWKLDRFVTTALETVKTKQERQVAEEEKKRAAEESAAEAAKRRQEVEEKLNLEKKTEQQSGGAAEAGTTKAAEVGDDNRASVSWLLISLKAVTNQLEEEAFSSYLAGWKGSRSKLY